jgi:hypothetical protein
MREDASFDLEKAACDDEAAIDRAGVADGGKAGRTDKLSRSSLDVFVSASGNLVALPGRCKPPHLRMSHGASGYMARCE